MVDPGDSRPGWSSGQRHRGRGEQGAPPRLRSELVYFSTQVSRRSTYWTGISL